MKLEIFWMRQLPFQRAWYHRVGDHVRGNRAPNRSCPFGLRLDQRGWKGILSFWISLGFFDLDKKIKITFWLFKSTFFKASQNWTELIFRSTENYDRFSLALNFVHTLPPSQNEAYVLVKKNHGNYVKELFINGF